jgi:hypothetical protein
LASSATEQVFGAAQNALVVLFRSWGKYVRHRVFWASFSYSMIYFTVLDGGSIMASFLKWAGIPEGIIGLTRGVGALMGLLGSALFVTVRHLLGTLERTGTTSIWLFWLTLLPVSVAAGFVNDVTTFGYVVMVCVAAARCSLWLFDLDHTLIMQVYIADGERAELNSTQSALYRVFWVLLSVVAMILSQPQQFRILALMSLAVVGTSAGVFGLWASRQRSHGSEVDEVGMGTPTPPKPAAPAVEAVEETSQAN